MCGICGISGITEKMIIEKMVAAMHHRGPDAQSYFFEEDIGIGAARLAIVDLNIEANQPMSNAENDILIAFNGEIYNYSEERDILLKKGVVFKTRSDTEVVLKMYEFYGADFLNRLNGMFALAIFDKRNSRKKILLARDRLGIKPLLYYKKNRVFAFASEMKTLLACPFIPFNLNPVAFQTLLAFGSVYQPDTILKDVYMLEAGHYLLFENNEFIINKFREQDNNNLYTNDLPYEELILITKEKLFEAVHSHLIGDVPVGAFLSGGIDSSLLVAIMMTFVGRNVKTFSIGYESNSKEKDETENAALIAKHLGSIHTAKKILPSDIKSDIFDFVKSIDQPSVDGINSFYVCKTAKQFTKVAFSGTGADELLAGYPWFKRMQIFNSHNKLFSTQKFRKALGLQLNSCNINILNLIKTYKAQNNFYNSFALQYYIFSSDLISDIIHPDYQADNDFNLLGYYKDIDNNPNHSILQKTSSLCIGTYLKNQLLRDIDATSMAHSLEVRVPYLDFPFVQWAINLPDNAKIHPASKEFYSNSDSYANSGLKRILFDIGKDLLPSALYSRSKRGFTMPFDYWLRTSLKDILKDTLSESSIKERGIFNYKTVKKIKRMYDLKLIGWQQPWLLLIIELWCRENSINHYR